MSKKILKRSLVLGALMAFVITGSAMASVIVDYSDWPRYHCLQNTVDKVDSTNIIDGATNRLIGGWFVGSNNKNDVIDDVKTLNSDVTIESGNWNLVIGGNYINVGKNNQESITFDVQSTKVTVNGGQIHQLAAGTGGTDNWELRHSGATSSTLIINDGIFGKTGIVGNAPELLVTAGDLLKDGDDESENWKRGAVSSIVDVTTEINGGTFNAAVIGGSSAIQYYGTTGDDLGDAEEERLGLNTTVTNVSTTINGGTFNHAIVAGGFAYGWYATSTVDNATLNIKGNTDAELNMNCDIYAGGMVGNVQHDRFQTNGVNELATITKVDRTVININDATVGNIYGRNALLKNLASGNAGDWHYEADNNDYAIVNTTLSLTNVEANIVDIPEGSIALRVEDSEGVTGKTSITTLTTGDGVTTTASANGEVNDAVGGDLKEAGKRITIASKAIVNENGALEGVSSFILEEGEVAGKTTLNSDGTVTVNANQGNTGISDISSVALMAWRAETNDMNKRLGELRNANGEHGVWVRMVRGESEYNSVKNQYNQYQLGYDEKLSVDKSWTVGMALSYTDAESSFSKGSGENTHKGLAIYGSKLNDDGSFVDLIAKYSRLEHDFDLGTAEGDYDTNGYSVSAEYGKRFQQGNGLWIEPQVELTYGQVDSATYMVGGRTVNQDSMESLVGRVGFSLGKDISKGNVYARASYLYDFEGETSATYTKGGSQGFFEQDLGGGWWEVGVGANINLSKATYIYADVEKTFGGEIDTNWKWNLGVRYSF